MPSYLKDFKNCDILKFSVSVDLYSLTSSNLISGINVKQQQKVPPEPYIEGICHHFNAPCHVCNASHSAQVGR